MLVGSRPRGGRREPRSGRRPASAASRSANWVSIRASRSSSSGSPTGRDSSSTTVARSSASDRACSSRAAVDPASSASTASRCSNATSDSCSATTSSGVTMFSTRAASASSRPSTPPGRRPGDLRAPRRAPRSRPATPGARRASSVSPRLSRRARQRIETALGRRVGDGALGECRNGGAELLEPGCQRGVGCRSGGRVGRQLGNGGVDPREIEGEPGHSGLQRAECLLDAAGDALEALRQRRERRLDPLRAGNGRLDALGEVGDPVVELLGRLGCACPDTLRELGDSILEPSCVLIVVVVRLGRAPRRGGRRRDRQELDRRALVGPLLGERARELEAGDAAELDENLAERLPRLLVLDVAFARSSSEANPSSSTMSPIRRPFVAGTALMRRHPAPDSVDRSGPAVAERRQGAHTLRIGIDGVPLAHSSQGRRLEVPW